MGKEPSWVGNGINRGLGWLLVIGQRSDGINSGLLVLSNFLNTLNSIASILEVHQAE